MGLFDVFKRKAKKESFLICSKCNKASTIPDDHITSYICPACKQLIHLQDSDATIIDINRQANGSERILTVLCQDDEIGYFCIRQSSGAYSGLGLWYYIIPKEIANPKIEDYICDYENFICVPNQWFSDAFSDDIYGKRRMSINEKL